MSERGKWEIETVEPQPVVASSKPEAPPPVASGPSPIKRFFQAVWTVCFLSFLFVVYTGFVFMLAQNLKGWHFTANYISSDQCPTQAIATRPIPEPEQ